VARRPGRGTPSPSYGARVLLAALRPGVLMMFIGMLAGIAIGYHNQNLPLWATFATVTFGWALFCVTEPWRDRGRRR
jgi:hypothetical protein